MAVSFCLVSLRLACRPLLGLCAARVPTCNAAKERSEPGSTTCATSPMRGSAGAAGGGGGGHVNLKNDSQGDKCRFIFLPRTP